MNLASHLTDLNLSRERVRLNKLLYNVRKIERKHYDTPKSLDLFTDHKGYIYIGYKLLTSKNLNPKKMDL